MIGSRVPNPGWPAMKFEVPDTGGLICGFALRGTAGCESLRWGTESGEPGELPPVVDAPLWLHFNLVDTRAQSWIAACANLPEDAREMLLEIDPHVRLEPLGDGLCGALGDLHHDFDEDPDGLGVIKIYLGHDLVVTGRRHPLRSTNELRREIIAGAEIDSPILWLAHFVHQLAETFGRVVTGLGGGIDDVEDRILAGHYSQEGKELGRVRRLLARLRRQLAGNRHALLHARARLPRWSPEEHVLELRQAIERLDAVAQDIELVQERSRLLQEEIAGRLGEATNRNLYLLSIVTTVLLPITLVTGIFGMNVGGLPWLQDGNGFWVVMLLMAFIAGATLAILHWRKFY